MGSQQTGKTSK